MSIILASIAILGAAFTRLVPEDGISKAFTLRGEGANAVVQASEELNFMMYGTYTKITGHVASHADNQAAARFTFRILAGGKEIFSRANMKGSDVPQLIAVDIPGDTHWIKFTFTPDDESEASKSAKGVWKQTEMIAE